MIIVRNLGTDFFNSMCNLLYNTVLDLRSLYDAEYVIVPDDEHENTEAMDLARIKKNKKKKKTKRAKKI